VLTNDWVFRKGYVPGILMLFGNIRQKFCRTDSTDYLYIKKMWWKSMLKKPEEIDVPFCTSKIPNREKMFFIFFMAL